MIVCAWKEKKSAKIIGKDEFVKVYFYEQIVEKMNMDSEQGQLTEVG